MFQPNIFDGYQRDYVPPGFYRVDVFLNEWFVIPTRYNFIRYLGRGSQGCVAKFFDTVRNCDVVIKKVSLPEDLTNRTPFKRAIRELHCMIYMNHPNVVSFYNSFTPHQSAAEMREFYIVREFLIGTMRLIKNEQLMHEHVQQVVHDICRGVQHMHQLGIAHRDLKPENILCSNNSEAKLCDFGQSNTADPFMQTPYIVMRYYRAPEIVCHVYDRRNTNVDVWSIGCILYELLTGRVLFQGDDHIDQFRKIVQRLGTPDESFYARMAPDVRDFVMTIERYPVRAFDQIFPIDMFLPNYRTNPELCNQVRDLLSRMLVIDPSNRISINQCLQHPYLRELSDEYEFDVVLANPRVCDVYNWQDYFDANAHREEIFNILNNFQTSRNIFDDVEFPQ